MQKTFNPIKTLKCLRICDLCAANLWMNFKVSEGTFINIMHLRGCVFDWCMYFFLFRCKRNEEQVHLT